MSLRIICQPEHVSDWITQRQGTPARERGSDAALRVLFGNAAGDHEKLSLDELIEAMKMHHLVLLVDDLPGQTFHKFVVRG